MWGFGNKIYSIYRANSETSRVESLKILCNFNKEFETGCLLLLGNLTSASKFLTNLTLFLVVYTPGVSKHFVWGYRIILSSKILSKNDKFSMFYNFLTIKKLQNM